MLEALCERCGETFIPADEGDTVHIEREDGTPCGGQGEILGEWTRKADTCYTIYTAGPVRSRVGTLKDVMAFVEQNAPLKRGWTGKWSVYPSDTGTYYYTRRNSRGNVVKGFGIRVTLECWEVDQPQDCPIPHRFSSECAKDHPHI